MTLNCPGIGIIHIQIKREVHHLTRKKTKTEDSSYWGFKSHVPRSTHTKSIVNPRIQQSIDKDNNETWDEAAFSIFCHLFVSLFIWMDFPFHRWRRSGGSVSYCFPDHAGNKQKRQTIGNKKGKKFIIVRPHPQFNLFGLWPLVIEKPGSAPVKSGIITSHSNSDWTSSWSLHLLFLAGKKKHFTAQRP